MNPSSCQQIFLQQNLTIHYIQVVQYRNHTLNSSCSSPVGLHLPQRLKLWGNWWSVFWELLSSTSTHSSCEPSSQQILSSSIFLRWAWSALFGTVYPLSSASMLTYPILTNIPTICCGFVFASTFALDGGNGYLISKCPSVSVVLYTFLIQLNISCSHSSPPVHENDAQSRSKATRAPERPHHHLTAASSGSSFCRSCMAAVRSCPKLMLLESPSPYLAHCLLSRSLILSTLSDERRFDYSIYFLLLTPKFQVSFLQVQSIDRLFLSPAPIHPDHCIMEAVP